MRLLRLPLLALLALVLVIDGMAVAEDDPDASPAESSPEAEPADGGILAVGSMFNDGTGVVRIFVDRDQNNTYETRIDEFAPYTRSVRNGVRVALGDFDGDGNDELVTATGGNTPIRIYDITSDGSHGAQLLAFGGFRRGAQVATGDINGDGRDELVTAADRRGHVVQVRADLLATGLPTSVVDTFNAYTQRRGIRVALGDIDTTTGAELITAMGPGAAGQVRVWGNVDNDLQFSDDGLTDAFLPFGANFEGGTSVATAVPQGGGVGNRESIIFGPESGRKRVRVRHDTDGDGDVSDDPVLEQFFPYGSRYRGGVRLAGGDLDRSSFFEELAIAPASNARGRRVRIIDDNVVVGTAVYSQGAQLQAFQPFPGVKAGEFLAVGAQFTDRYAAQTVPQTIPESGAGSLTVDITVPASAGVIRDLDVFLGISHTFNGDLDVSMQHLATGASLILFNDVGGTDEGFLVTLNDEAGTDIGTANNPADGAITGSFNPEGAALLSVFDGVDASGVWRLTITDDNAAGADVGALQAWELRIGV